MPAEPISPSSLIFPSASTSISKTLTQLNRTNLSITNRLHSIDQDAAFVQDVAQTLDLPLIANERCGSWYVPPERKAGSAYFKSTDGHFGVWSFSLRRLNLEVLETVGRCGGCIIVDSTRRGKSMPDALSKTIGIWKAVLNRLLFDQGHELITPSEVVSDSEHAQMDARLDGFVKSARCLDLDLEGLRAKLKRPMRPVWVTPATDVSSLQPPSPDDAFATIVLCTASSRVSQEVANDADYVQGAADDAEAWALGLDAVTFWKGKERLLAASEDDLPGLIAELVRARSASKEARAASLIKPTSSIWIGDRASQSVAPTDYQAIVTCGSMPSPGLRRAFAAFGGVHIHLQCATGKIGSRQIRALLPQLEQLRKLEDPQARVLVACPTGKDLSVGVALALLCMYCNPAGELSWHVRQTAAPSKVEIKKRLSWIMVSMPHASPSRATLQSVNAFLMS